MIIPSAVPRSIERVCCVGKTCGPVDLYLAVTALIDATGTVVPKVGYKRDNGDWYFGPYATLDELTKALDNPTFKVMGAAGAAAR